LDATDSTSLSASPRRPAAAANRALRNEPYSSSLR
jgi:hypothetical protein